MGKPFLTIQQQIELLEPSGVKTDDASGSILLREGYYSVVNGYKDPFIDRGQRLRPEMIGIGKGQLSLIFTTCFLLIEN